MSKKMQFQIGNQSLSLNLPKFPNLSSYEDFSELFKLFINKTEKIISILFLVTLLAYFSISGSNSTTYFGLVLPFVFISGGLLVLGKLFGNKPVLTIFENDVLLMSFVTFVTLVQLTGFFTETIAQESILIINSSSSLLYIISLFVVYFLYRNLHTFGPKKFLYTLVAMTFLGVVVQTNSVLGGIYLILSSLLLLFVDIGIVKRLGRKVGVISNLIYFFITWEIFEDTQISTELTNTLLILSPLLVMVSSSIKGHSIFRSLAKMSLIIFLVLIIISTSINFILNVLAFSVILFNLLFSLLNKNLFGEFYSMLLSSKGKLKIRDGLSGYFYLQILSFVAVIYTLCSGLIFGHIFLGFDYDFAIVSAATAKHLLFGFANEGLLTFSLGLIANFGILGFLFFYTTKFLILKKFLSFGDKSKNFVTKISISLPILIFIILGLITIPDGSSFVLLWVILGLISTVHYKPESRAELKGGSKASKSLFFSSLIEGKKYERGIKLFIEFGKLLIAVGVIYATYVLIAATQSYSS